jgi:hypothetical protein
MPITRPPLPTYSRLLILLGWMVLGVLECVWVERGELVGLGLGL